MVILILSFMAAAAPPLLIAAGLARRDYVRGQRRSGYWTLILGAAASCVFLGVIALLYVRMAMQPRPPGVSFGIAWSFLLFGSGFAFLVGALSASTGYAVSYRIAQRSMPAIDSDAQGGLGRADAPVQETGNPYQPPQ